MATPGTMLHSGHVNSEKTYQLTASGRFAADRLIILGNIGETLSEERELAHASGVSLQTAFGDYHSFLIEFLGESFVCKSIDILNKYVETALEALVERGDYTFVKRSDGTRKIDAQQWRKDLRRLLDIRDELHWHIEALAVIRNAITHNHGYLKDALKWEWFRDTLADLPFLDASSGRIVFLERSGLVVAHMVMYVILEHEVVLIRRYKQLETKPYNFPVRSK